MHFSQMVTVITLTWLLNSLWSCNSNILSVLCSVFATPPMCAFRNNFLITLNCSTLIYQNHNVAKYLHVPRLVHLNMFHFVNGIGKKDVIYCDKCVLLSRILWEQLVNCIRLITRDWLYMNKHNSKHILQQFLHDRTTTYSLGSRNHRKALVNKTSHLNNSDFLIRLLYKYPY